MILPLDFITKCAIIIDKFISNCVNLYGGADKLTVQLNAEGLREILTTFYDMNGIRIAVFDAGYNEIMEYPPKKCDFCRRVRESAELHALCQKNDIAAFERCRETGDIYIYECHAGLVEAATQLYYDDSIIGYMMLGQITDIKSKGKLGEVVREFNRKYGMACDPSGIKFRSRRQIEAAARILKICAEYIMLKELIEPEGERVVAMAKTYIKAHLSEQMSVEEIAEACGCSRTRLYEMFRTEVGVGVAHYIAEKRLREARNLLRTTDLPVGEVSERCGFCDYNYFGRVYKKRFGVSPRRERE